MQRKQCELERGANDEERVGNDDRRVGAIGAHLPGQVGHVEGAGHRIEETDADDDEGGPDGADDEVLEGRHQRPPIAPRGDQHVAAERRDLQEHEQIEGIAGDGDTEQAREGEQVGAVEQVIAVAPELRENAVPGEQHDDGADTGDDQQHEGVERVDAVLDPPGRRPTAECVNDHANPLHFGIQQAGHDEGRPGCQRRRPPGHVALAQQHAQRRRDEGNGNLQDRKVKRDHGLIRPSPGPGFRPPRWCRRPRGCAPRAPVQRRSWRCRRRWR